VIRSATQRFTTRKCSILCTQFAQSAVLLHMSKHHQFLNSVLIVTWCWYTANITTN
jgi:hypothetical protein